MDQWRLATLLKAVMEDRQWSVSDESSIVGAITRACETQVWWMKMIVPMGLYFSRGKSILLLAQRKVIHVFVKEI